MCCPEGEFAHSPSTHNNKVWTELTTPDIATLCPWHQEDIQMRTIKIGMYEVNEQLIIRYYNVLKAIFHDGGNNFTEYGRRRTKIHNEILTSVRLK